MPLSEIDCVVAAGGAGAPRQRERAGRRGRVRRGGGPLPVPGHAPGPGLVHRGPALGRSTLWVRAERRRTRHERKTDHQIAERQRHAERKKRAGLDREVGTKLLQDLRHDVDVLALIELGVGRVEVAVPESLGRDLTGQPIGRAPLRRDDHQHPSAPLVEQPPGLAHGARQVRQVLEHVDGQVAIEESVGKIHPLLAVAHNGPHRREAARDLGPMLGRNSLQ